MSVCLYVLLISKNKKSEDVCSSPSKTFGQPKNRKKMNFIVYYLKYIDNNKLIKNIKIN